MKNIFQLFRIHQSSHPKETSSSGKTDIKTETKAYVRMPMTFDFTAYFDDSEYDNLSDNISQENNQLASNSEIPCKNDETSTVIIHSSGCTELGYCTN